MCDATAQANLLYLFVVCHKNMTQWHSFVFVLFIQKRFAENTVVHAVLCELSGTTTRCSCQSVTEQLLWIKEVQFPFFFLQKEQRDGSSWGRWGRRSVYYSTLPQQQHFPPTNLGSFEAATFSVKSGENTFGAGMTCNLTTQNPSPVSVFGFVGVL